VFTTEAQRKQRATEGLGSARLNTTLREIVFDGSRVLDHRRVRACKPIPFSVALCESL
jgi:hypothetical protein